MQEEVELGAGDLGLEALEAIAGGAKVAVSEAGLARMAEGRRVLTQAIKADTPIYGVTTGLGPRVVDRLDEAVRADFPADTVRGRAHALGPPLAPGIVRVAMAARAQSMLTGATGARPVLAEMLAGCLNAGLTPVVGETATIGAGDLMWGGMIGLGMIGEGEMETPEGRMPAPAALAAHGLAPLKLMPREGLAFVSNSSPTAAVAATGLIALCARLHAAQAAAALSLEGFRGNLSPLDSDVLALSPKPGQARAAEGLLSWLEGSGLHAPGAARRLQDPLSLRNIVQVQGAVFAAADWLEAAVLPEINTPTDNPVVLIGRGKVLSGGSYMSPQVAIAAQALNDAARHLAAQSVGRVQKLISARFSELPAGLSRLGIGSVGFGAMMKVVETLAAEIGHLAAPAPVYPSISADGVEDTLTHAAIPAKAMHAIAEKLAYLIAIELMVATQAAEMRETAVAPRLADVMEQVRAHAAPLDRDRSLTAEIEALKAAIVAGELPRMGT
ncbi:MAG: aromatic amino acid lyase [Pseudomonadota bacterium]